MRESLIKRRQVAKLVGSVGLLAAGGTRAQPADLLGRLRQNRKVTVAIPDNRPYSGLNPDGSATGVAPSIVKAVLERMGIPGMEGTTVGYGQLIPGLQAGRWDMICACLQITKDRCNAVAFADPIVTEGGVFVYMPARLADPPKSLADVLARGLRIATGQGSVTTSKIKAAGIASDKVVTTPDLGANFLALETGRADVAYNTYYGALAESKARGDAFRLVYPLADDRPNGSGCAFRKADASFLEAFQGELRAIKASGDFARIATQFGFPPDETTLRATAAEECQRSG